MLPLVVMRPILLIWASVNQRLPSVPLHIGSGRRVVAETTQDRGGLIHEGFFEEDGMFWASDGRLLAQSRQLAILLPA